MRNLSCGSLDYFQESKSSCRWLQIFLLWSFDSNTTIIIKWQVESIPWLSMTICLGTKIQRIRVRRWEVQKGTERYLKVYLIEACTVQLCTNLFGCWNPWIFVIIIGLSPITGAWQSTIEYLI
jgi:hypothetical protein